MAGNKNSGRKKPTQQIKVSREEYRLMTLAARKEYRHWRKAEIAKAKANPGKVGKPRGELTTEQIAQIDGLSALLSDYQLADYFGIDRMTFAGYVRDDEEISKRIKKGRSMLVAKFAKNLVQQSDEGNVTATIFGLKTRGGDDWKEKQIIDHTSSDKSMSPAKQLSDDEVKQAIAEIYGQCQSAPTSQSES